MRVKEINCDENQFLKMRGVFLSFIQISPELAYLLGQPNSAERAAV